MRDIRFRAWNGEAMEYGGFSVHATAGNIQPTPLTKVTAESPLMQYTGLKDKNGVEIYEGDIVALGACHFEVRFGHYDNGGDYEQNDSGYGWYTSHGGEGCGSAISYPHLSGNMGDEVIGNIHENPELLDAE